MRDPCLTITALHRKNNTRLASGWDFILYKKFNDFYIFYSFLGLKKFNDFYIFYSFLGLSFLGLRS